MKSLPFRTAASLVRPRHREEVREWRPIRRRRAHWRSILVLAMLASLAATLVYLQP
jgi:hypothetical protein